jgi:dipeptidyl aminopeptidase/acylaminoacyl peptidase|nr:S9 family peptidase [Kofleriaceae bacterium]
MKRAVLLLLPLLVAAKGLTIEDMLAMQRISDPAVSPDGKWVAFTVRDTDYEANRGRSDIYMTATDGTGSATRMTTSPDSDSDPSWSSDGKWIYFMSSRGGSSQVWRIGATGGEAEAVTKLPVDVDGYKLFPDGKRLALVARVWPDAKTLADSAKHDDDKAKSKVHAHIATELLYRHWDTWNDGKTSHLFAWDASKPADARDLTPGSTSDVPPGPFGGMDQISIAPDGRVVAFVQRVGGRESAWTTNTDVFLVPSDGRGAPIDLTVANKAYDFSPTFSPDGKTIAVLAMARPGFEADRQRITLYDAASRQSKVIANDWDRSPASVTWSADGKTIYTSAEDLGLQPIFAIDVATGKPTKVSDKGTNSDPRVAGSRIVFAKDTLVQPTELFAANPDGSGLKQITHFNDARAAKIAWGAYEQFSFAGAKGDKVYGYVVKPANFSGGGKVPVAFLIHGGPQGSFGDHFHYRWNPEVFAGHGYAVVMIDFHGSTGYGQAFTDAISGDWGGAPFDDLMKGLDAAVAKYSFLDNDRVAALGASYGGYMINWINGNTNRFKALVCHDGIFDTRMGYYDTEELWFPEWEHRGTPWDKPEEFSKFNPAEKVGNWKTPELVIHGGQDFRIPESHGMAAFTALQRRGIASKFIEFPDENHWVLKPQNSKLWHDEVLAWIDRWTAKR